MTDMVERVARAICEQWSGSQNDIPLHDGQRILAFSFARAAIAAMREPTLEMIHAGCTDDAFMAQDDVPPSGHFSPKPVWQAMIDAALKAGESDD